MNQRSAYANIRIAFYVPQIEVALVTAQKERGT
jgi:hypothetical protein